MTDTTVDLDTELEAGDTFPRDYVEKLRAEAAKHRTAAKEVQTKLDELTGTVTGYQEELFRSRVAAAGKLADPTDLPFDAALLESPEALAGAIDGLLATKPHLATRRVSEDIGQGAGGAATEAFSLAGMLHSNA